MFCFFGFLNWQMLKVNYYHREEALKIPLLKKNDPLLFLKFASGSVNLLFPPPNHRVKLRFSVPSGLGVAIGPALGDDVRGKVLSNFGRKHKGPECVFMVHLCLCLGDQRHGKLLC